MPYQIPIYTVTTVFSVPPHPPHPLPLLILILATPPHFCVPLRIETLKSRSPEHEPRRTNYDLVLQCRTVAAHTERAKRSIREEQRSQEGTDLAPLPLSRPRGGADPLSRELLPKSFFRVLNAERVRAEYRAKCKNWEDYVDGDGEDGGGKKKWRKLDGEEWEETKISPARGWRVLTRPPPLAIGRLHRPDGLISMYAVAFPAGHRWIESDMRPAHSCAPQRRPTTRAGKKVLLLLYTASSAPTVP
ncbi:hypothetical protein B0H11DRAFT_2247584 [Mycena galericulata]|nr:hypothetical protein B0H11DRAFT_2247584 [Mycena galericulata]